MQCQICLGLYHQKTLFTDNIIDVIIVITTHRFWFCALKFFGLACFKNDLGQYYFLQNKWPLLFHVITFVSTHISSSVG